MEYGEAHLQSRCESRLWVRTLGSVDIQDFHRDDFVIQVPVWRVYAARFLTNLGT